MDLHVFPILIPLPKAGFRISTSVIFFFLLVGGPKNQFYFSFSYEEHYNSIIFILPLKGHSTYISKSILFFCSVVKVLSEIMLLTS